MPEKLTSHLSPRSGKPYNHNAKEILWLFLFSQDLVKIWKHTVIISEGRESANWGNRSSPSVVGPKELTRTRESGNRAQGVGVGPHRAWSPARSPILLKSDRATVITSAHPQAQWGDAVWLQVLLSVRRSQSELCFGLFILEPQRCSVTFSKNARHSTQSPSWPPQSGTHWQAEPGSATPKAIV